MPFESSSLLLGKMAMIIDNHGQNAKEERERERRLNKQQSIINSSNQQKVTMMIDNSTMR